MKPSFDDSLEGVYVMWMTIGAIDKNSSVPLHFQIETRLRLAIAQGVWQVGDLLPTEAEMSLVFGVSRGTVRQALDALVREGLIVRERRKGTRLLRGVTGDGLILVTPFGAIQAAGMKPRVDILTLGEEPTPEFIQERWADKTERAVHFERVFLADGQPVAYGDSYLPAGRFRDIIQMRLSEQALVDVVHRHFGVCITRLDQTSELAPVPDRIAGLLALPERVVAFHAMLWQWMGDSPVEYGEFWFPRDKSRLLIAGLYAFDQEPGRTPAERR